MCIRQLFRHFVVAKRKQVREHNRDVTLAWYGVVMHLASYAKGGKKRKAPELQKFLVNEDAKPGQQRKQTPQQIRSLILALSEQYGGVVRKGGEVIKRIPQIKAKRRKSDGK